MGKGGFFPWFFVKEPVVCGEFQVLPYQRGVFPGAQTSEQDTLDLVVGRYREANDLQVSRASILQHSSQTGPTDPVEEGLHVDSFVFADLLPFSALANRRFFGDLEYSNRDSFRLIVQQYTEPGRGVMVTPRRRDGSTNIFCSGEVLTDQRPRHVYHQRTPIDEPLLEKLVDARGHSDWPELDQTIVRFDEANTDRLEFPASTELLLTYAAFEQALGVPGEKTKRVGHVFSEVMQPREELDPAEWTIQVGNPRAQQFLSSAPSRRSGWVQD